MSKAPFLALAGSSFLRLVPAPNQMDVLISKRKWSFITRWWWLGALLLAGAAARLYWPRPGQRLHVAASRLTISPVTRGNFQEFTAIDGVVQPLRTVYLDAVEAGTVQQVLVEEGTTLTAGQPLLRLANPDLQLEMVNRETAVYELMNNLRNVTTLPQHYWDQLHQNLGQQVQFALSIPILNGLQVRTNVQRTLINARQVQLQAEQARLTLRQSIEQAYADARAAQLQYAAAKRQVTALITTQRNAEIRFNNGLLNGTEFNVIKNNLNFAISNQLQAKYTFLFRRKVLAFYDGRSLTR